MKIGQREAAGTKVHSTEHKGSESLKPKKASSIENEHSKHELSSIEIEVHRGGDGEVTGHTVTHRMRPKPTKSGAFSEYKEPAKYVFDGKGESTSHGSLADHMAEHMPHLFSEEHGAISAENKHGEGDDDEHEDYV